MACNANQPTSQFGMLWFINSFLSLCTQSLSEHFSMEPKTLSKQSVKWVAHWLKSHIFQIQTYYRIIQISIFPLSHCFWHTLIQSHWHHFVLSLIFSHVQYICAKASFHLSCYTQLNLYITINIEVKGMTTLALREYYSCHGILGHDFHYFYLISLEWKWVDFLWMDVS